MSNVSYDVEVIKQEQNPICWVASCAMVEGFGTNTSVGIGKLTGGFDPSNSCIANLAANWTECTDTMTSWGFTVSTVGDVVGGGSLTGDGLLTTLQGSGPAVLLHMCQGFPYGAQWASQTFGPNDAHAIVITGVNTDAGTATFNNPWGDKDQSCDLPTLLQHINADTKQGKTLGFWPITGTSTSTATSSTATAGGS